MSAILKIGEIILYKDPSPQWVSAMVRARNTCGDRAVGELIDRVEREEGRAISVADLERLISLHEKA